MPLRDAAATLPACLDSILAQHLRDWELVAVDDGSRDASPAILAAAAAGDARVRPVRSRGRGLVAALDTGVAAARAPLVARMDADDLMHPDRLRAQARAMRAAPRVAVLGCRVRAFPAAEIRAGMREYLRWQNACRHPARIATQIYVESPFTHPSVMMRADALRAVGGYRDGDFPEDYDLWLRMHRRGFALAKLSRVLLCWRQGPASLSRRDPRYARAAFDRLRATHLAADPRLAAGRRLVVWGAGRRTRQRVRALAAHGLEPSAWIDIDPAKIGRVYGGAPVHAPAWLEAPPGGRPFVLVYVAVHGAREAIAAALEAMGYRAGEDYLAVG